MPKQGVPEDKIAIIVAAILARPDSGPTTWEDIRDISKKVIGVRLTRQALAAYSDIVKAYDQHATAHRKVKRRIRVAPPKPGDPKDRRIIALENELAAAKQIINDYDKLYVLILHNTSRLGFRREELERPLSTARLTT